MSSPQSYGLPAGPSPLPNDVRLYRNETYCKGNGVAETRISRDEIVREAIALLQQVGLDQVSLRKLATRLGVEAASLYWHVSNKAELYALVCEQIFNDVLHAMGECPDWESWLRRFGEELWRAQIEIKDVARLVLATDFGEERLRDM